ncbi:hypothetical protein K466DRAFT_668266 [Polyporus arcularius HHB13444]|uniref:Uncharacterized protein n=1 Tax=Polyporus arcularius HHB13444 TaxID=1314778 RepID=A0A5C3NP21_9APHY|nr:hypothetical protein K466DRAFT_668266 [Polyporus arcularius HHB13444]
MAASNVTIDDTSSLLSYEPAGVWAHASGRDAQSYGNSTFSSAQTEGATAKFSFTGTGFWVYGATKPENGQYILLLDSQVILYANATSNEPQFGRVLGGSSGLADGEHEVVLMAAGGGPVDIDAVVYETTSDQRQGSVPTTGTQTVSASSSSQSVPRLSATPNAKTGGSDDTASDQAPSSSSNAAATSEQPDVPSTAQPNTQASAQPGDQSSQGNPQSNPQTSPQATAQLSARPNASAGAAASAAPSSSQPQGATTTANFLSPTISQAQSAGDIPIAGTTQAQRGLPMGAIIGIAIGAVVGLLLLVALFFLLLRRRRAKARRHANVTLASPVLPLQNPDTQGGYFFGGFARGQSANPMRELYLRTSPAMPQAPSPVHAGRRSGVELLPASTFRDSSGSYADTATLVSEGGTDMSMKMAPTRPTRPPELHLDV